MADNPEPSGDAQLTFKVKTSGDAIHTITIPETATVLELKTKLAGGDFENIPVERQRLIYSGHVLKNDDTLAKYKIKHNNTVHMVKSAASNPGQPASSSTTPNRTNQNIPSNIAAGTNNNPLAGLTGARYAGHQVNLPGMDMFGPDGGMGGPAMDEERMARMLEDPNTLQQLNEAMSNPQFIDMMIESNPTLRNIPHAREVLQSPMMRQMMTDPTMLRQAAQMQRSMRPGGAFPAPGATDNTPEGAPASQGGDNAGQQQQGANPFMGQNPFMPFGMGGQGQGGNPPDLGQLSQQLQQLQSMMGMRGGNNANPQGEAGTTTGAGAGTTEGQQQGGAQQQNPANPFAALFGGAGAGGGLGGAGAGAGANPFGMNPEQMQQMMQMFGGGGAGPQAPADNRPPEERYEDQLRQLNDMGFFDFDRNVAALRRSGGSVQGAVEFLLTATD